MQWPPCCTAIIRVNPGEWVPNRHGGRENLEAIDFLRHLNDVVALEAPGALMIAEESTAWPGVSQRTDEGGLGFSYKWNMGWMHDSLHYIQQDPVYRAHHHNELSFGLVYAWTERFILPISHDEVVHGKHSLIDKMPGDRWQKFANLRAYLSFMWTHPGKKLLFMGCEFGQWREWNHDQQLDWYLLQYPEHQGVQKLVGDLNRLYRDCPALHDQDDVAQGFQWLIGDDATNSVYAWLRWSKDGQPLLVVANFTPCRVRDTGLACRSRAPGKKCSTATPILTRAPTMAMAEAWALSRCPATGKPIHWP
jgi:1,4-alpha-glucan branching enzyme